MFSKVLMITGKKKVEDKRQNRVILPFIFYLSTNSRHLGNVVIPHHHGQIC